MSKLENFKGKQNTNGLRENPQNINKSGANRSVLTEIKKKLLEDEYLSLTGVELLGPDGSPTGESVNVRVRLLSVEGMALHYLNRAKKSDKIMVDLLDRLYGKATQNVNQTIDVSKLSDDQVELLYSRLLANLINQ